MLKGTGPPARTITLYTTRYKAKKALMKEKFYQYAGCAMLMLGLLVSANTLGVI
jgi:hypothetical protein